MIGRRDIQLGFIGLIALLTLPACFEKKCQKAADQPYKSITDSEWRLVETNDPNPNFKKLNNTTFFIFTFSKTYTGAINNVINNNKYDTPVRTFLYNISPSEKLIRIKYQLPPADDSNSTEEAPATTAEDNSAPIDYSYELKRDLTLTNLNSGAYYRMVPFTGIVDPDNECTF